MSRPRIGELFSGYGGLGMGVQAVYGGDIAWHSDIDKGACKILAHRYPDVPNIGDITAVDWATVEPVDILTGGSPCQDLSHAGRRQGMTEGTRSNLWVAMREAIAQLRPATVIWENVRGAYSAEAASELELCPGCMGADRFSRGPVLRALGRVLGDLSDLGYDARWHGLRAADVGAPHGRFRVFVVASLAGGIRRGARRTAGPGEASGGRPPADLAGRGDTPSLLMPTPQARDYKGYGPADANRNDPNLSAIPLLLPTPAVNDMGEGKTVEHWDEWTARMKAAHGNGNGHGASLAIEAQRLFGTPTASNKIRSGDFAKGRSLNPAEFALLPTPRVKNNENRQSESFHGEDGNFYGLLHNPDRWGDYAPAIARWEAISGRPAPEPTTTSTKGNPQLSHHFVEWLMGLPAGWITDVPGITRNEALKALGNGVVPQQAAEALRVMSAWEVAA